LLLASGDPAEKAAADAFQHASAENCRFLWGAAEAGQLLGQALALRGEHSSECAIPGVALDLRRRLGDPKLGQTERLLKRLGDAKT
jgi:hypothetical protein